MTELFECLESRLTRRSFLKAGAASAVLSFAALPEFTLGAETSDNRLIIILLRGGMDGLYAMPPIGDKNLSAHRKDLATDDVLKVDSFFGLHPAMKTLADLYKNGQALLVHGTSMPYTGRSHFEGQDIMQSGVMTPYASASGWAGRALEVAGYGSITMSMPVPLVLRGEAYAQSRFPTWMRSPPPELYARLAPLWAADPQISPYGAQIEAEILDPTNTLPPINPGNDETPLPLLANDAVARLKAPDGPRIAVLDYVGFDSHSRENIQHNVRLGGVDNAIRNIRLGMGDKWANTLVVTVTEFGRTIAENGSWGTDHGWGSSIFVTGGLLKKSGIVADWPGLKTNQLYEGRDLKATIDSRALYATIVSSVFQIDPDLVQRKVIQSPKDDRFSAYL